MAISINDWEALKLKAEDKELNLDLIDKQLVKKVQSRLGAGKASLWRGLGQARKVAEELQDEGLTVIIYYRGSKVVTIGLNARPTFSPLVTGSDAIQIDSLLKLIELGL